MRIIGGQWKRTPIPVVESRRLAPTPDRVRETVFNWLTSAFGGTLSGTTALDLFAGTGALGFEMASRGAATVVLVERIDTAAFALRSLQQKLQAPNQIEVIHADAFEAGRRLAASGRRFDVVFVDPPFRQELLAAAIRLAAELCMPDGVVYAESERPLGHDDDAVLTLEIVREGRAGDVFYHLLRYKK